MKSEINVITANLDKERSGDAKYIRFLLSTAHAPKVLFLQEVGSGLSSVQFRIRGRLGAVKRTLLTVGNVGVHRGVRRMTVTIDGKKVTMFSVHGLHRKTSGKAAHDRHLEKFAARINKKNKKNAPWIAGGDWNENIESVAKRLGGTAHGEGIVGFICSDEIEFFGKKVNSTGKRFGWTDHPSVHGKIRLK